MSGHSKWNTIKRKKAAMDAKRGKIFTKIIREIQVAARTGGGDEIANPRLKVAIQAAKAANMPTANIDRAIKKGIGELEGENYEEITYEAFGPGGMAIIMEVMTDNKNRTVSELRHILTRHNGNLATAGSVAWMFEKKGTILVDKAQCSEEDLFSVISEAGAEDFTVEDDVYEVTTDLHAFENVKKALEKNKIKFSDASINNVPHNTVKVDEELAPKILKLMDVLEDHDDMQKISANFDIDDELLAKLQEED
jgi:YebC/PmpR family DNA-binding regulatory protein